MKLLFVSPFSGIWEFASLEARVAAALRASGNEVIFVTCGQLLRRHCLVMAASGLSPTAGDEQRDKVCRACCASADGLRRELGLSGPQLIDLVDPLTRKEVLGLIAGLEPQRALDLVVDGVPVGRRALFPFLALKKKDGLDLSAEDWREYFDQLYNTILAVRAAQALIESYHPDAVITYSATYSVVAACLEVARINGIKDYFIEASGGMGSREYRAMLARTGIAHWFSELRRIWEIRRDQAAHREAIHIVTDHLLHLFRAESVFAYSPSAKSGDFDVREFCGARPKQRLLLVTMSSYDEWFAAEQAGLLPTHQSAFPSQIAWIQWLFELLVRRAELFVILRIHPREFPNRRDNKYSDHARRLLELLRLVPPNCFVNWPDQQKSLYDFAKEVDVVLNAWSSAGKEMSLLGLPVVEWAPDVLVYPPDPRYAAPVGDKYEACIDRALETGWSAETLRRMYRWCSLEFSAATFQSAPGDGRPAGLARAWVQRATRAMHRRVSPGGAQRATVRRSLISAAAAEQLSQAIAKGFSSLAEESAKADNSGSSSIEAEWETLRSEVKRLVIGLYGDLDGIGGPLKKRLVGMINTGPQLHDHGKASVVGILKSESHKPLDDE